MPTITATYSPEDNKLRLYSSTRLDAETYARVKAAGFAWAPKQELFVAPMWTPSRADLCTELAGEIGDEDTSLVDRAEERADRFTDYSANRAADADAAHSAVHAIADNIPLGQPILVGHHSERHARRDAEKIENGMRRAVKMWETSQYWKQRAAGAIRNAKYKELPAVRARRIKTIEAAARAEERTKAKAEKCVKFWDSAQPITRADAVKFCNYYDNMSASFPLDKFPRAEPASQYEGPMSLWSALGGSDDDAHAIITTEQAAALSLRAHRRVIEHCDRWIAHMSNRLEYERAMLGESGGIATDRNAPQKGGAVRCWCSPGHGKGWSYITKVNKISVSVLDNYGNGGRNFSRTIPFDNLKEVMSAADVQAKRDAEVLIETEDKLGFFLADAPPPIPRPEPEADPQEEQFAALRETLKAGVKVVTAPQLFPTPPDLAARMVKLADLEPGQTVLEPSAGTGNILAQIRLCNDTNPTTAVEINSALAAALRDRFHSCDIRQSDFLDCTRLELGSFDRILMNPPFANGQDIRHIRNAFELLNPGGRLVAICANGPRQDEQLRPFVEEHRGTWEELPGDTFKESGTSVRAVLLTIEAPDDEPEPAEPDDDDESNRMDADDEPAEIFALAPTASEPAQQLALFGHGA